MKLRSIFISIATSMIAGTLLFSCSSSEGLDGADVYVDGNTTADLKSLPLSAVDSVLFSCPDSIVLGSISKVYASGDMFVVVDLTPQAYGFKSNGEYVCKYGSRGEAPSEYVNLGACDITPSNDVVICDSYTQRMVFYDLFTGEFKRDVKFPIGSLDMVQQCCFTSDTTAILARYVYNNLNSVYASANLKTGKVNDFASVPMSTDNVAVPVGWHAITAYNGVASYIMPFSPFVYQYPDKKWIAIEQKKPIYNDDQLTAIKDFSIASYVKAIEDNVFVGYTDIYESKGWIFLGCQNLGFALIDKNNWRMTNYQYEKDNMLNYKIFAPIIGVKPEENILIGMNNSPLNELDQIYLYKLQD